MRVLKFNYCSRCYFFNRIDYFLKENLQEGYCGLDELLNKGRKNLIRIRLDGIWDNCPLNEGVTFIRGDLQK